MTVLGLIKNKKGDKIVYLDKDIYYFDERKIKNKCEIIINNKKYYVLGIKKSSDVSVLALDKEPIMYGSIIITGYNKKSISGLSYEDVWLIKQQIKSYIDIDDKTFKSILTCKKA